MNRIKNILNKISSSIIEIYRRYPISMILIYITTIILVFSDFIVDNKIKESLDMFLLLTSFGTLFVETFLVDAFKKNNKKIVLIIGIIVITIISGCFTYLWQSYSDYYKNDKISSEKDGEIFKTIGLYLLSYTIILSTLIIRFFIKKSNMDFSKFTVKVSYNFLKTSTLYGICISGISCLIFIFCGLLLNGINSWKFVGRILGLFTGFYYVPSLIYCLIELDEEVGKFIKSVILYVYLPIISLTMVIVYLYILKLIVLGTFLKEGIFGVLAIIYCFVFPIMILVDGIEAPDKIKKTIKILAYTFLPLILLEMIAMGIRVGEYGLTTIRYVSIEFILVQIVSFVLYFIKDKKYLDNLIYLISVLVVIELITPIKSENIVFANQKTRLNKLYSSKVGFDNYDYDTQKDIYDLYKYLERKDEKKLKQLEIYKENSKINKFENKNDDANFTYSNNKNRETSYLAYSMANWNFDVSNYKRMYKGESYIDENDNIRNIKIEINDKKTYKIEIEFDLKAIIERLIYLDGIRYSSDVLENIDVIEDKSGKYELKITSIRGSYFENDNTISYMNLDVLIFEK